MPRGRKPKAVVEAPVKRGRGRPRKNPIVTAGMSTQFGLAKVQMVETNRVYPNPMSLYQLTLDERVTDDKEIVWLSKQDKRQLNRIERKLKHIEQLLSKKR